MPAACYPTSMHLGLLAISHNPLLPVQVQASSPSYQPCAPNDQQPTESSSSILLYFCFLTSTRSFACSQHLASVQLHGSLQPRTSPPLAVWSTAVQPQNYSPTLKSLAAVFCMLMHHLPPPTVTLIKLISSVSTVIMQSFLPQTDIKSRRCRLLTGTAEHYSYL